MPSVTELETYTMIPQRLGRILDKLFLHNDWISISTYDQNLPMLQALALIPLCRRGILRRQARPDSSPLSLLVENGPVTDTGDEGLDETLMILRLPRHSRSDGDLWPQLGKHRTIKTGTLLVREFGNFFRNSICSRRPLTLLCRLNRHRRRRHRLQPFADDVL